MQLICVLAYVCRVWRYEAAPAVDAILTMCKRQADCPLMFAGLDLDALNMEEPAHLQSLRDHAAQHCLDHHDCPGTAWGTQLGEQVEEWMPTVSKFSWHWFHAQQLCKEMKAMGEKPEAGVLYMLFDFQDPQLQNPW